MKFQLSVSRPAPRSHPTLLSRAVCTVSGLALSAMTLWPATSATAAPTMKFPTTAGRVTYKMNTTGNFASSGTVAMTWTDKGRRFYQESSSNTKFRGRSSNFTTKIICDGTSIYLIMPGSKQAMKVPANSKAANLYNPILAFTRGQAGKVVGRGNVLGKPCEIRSVSISNRGSNIRTKLWIWQGLPLRAEAAMQFSTPSGGKTAQRQMAPTKVTMNATSLNTNIRPAASLFRLPAGYTAKEFGPPRRRR